MKKSELLELISKRLPDELDATGFVLHVHGPGVAAFVCHELSCDLLRGIGERLAWRGRLLMEREEASFLLELPPRHSLTIHDPAPREKEREE